MSMLLPDFAYHRPGCLREALELVRELKLREAPLVFMSGGTDLIPTLKQQQAPPGTVVSLTGLSELQTISIDGDRLVIGAQTSLAYIVASDIIGSTVPGLASTAALIASPQIRRRATIGGNVMLDNRCIYYNQSETNRSAHQACFKSGGDVCHLVKSARRGDAPLCVARCCSDLAAVLLLLDARLQLRGPDGARNIALAEYYLPDGMHSKAIATHEILTHIDIPLPAPQGLTYEKLRIRKTLDFPSLGVAVSIDGQVGDLYLGIAVVGVHTHPGLFGFCEKDFSDRTQMLRRACLEATAFAVTYRQDQFPRAYRKQMIAVLIERGFNALTEAP